MPKIDNRWTVGNVATFLGILATLLSVLGIAYAQGQSWGDLSNRVGVLESTARQSVSDSRTLIELRTDVAYIKQAVQNLTRDLQSASSPLPCPPDQPVLVASHCRASAGLAFYE